MLVTDRTREALRCRRIRRKLAADGFEEIGESGGHLWELHRDIKRDHNTITAVGISPRRKKLFGKKKSQKFVGRPPAPRGGKIFGQNSRPAGPAFSPPSRRKPP